MRGTVRSIRHSRVHFRLEPAALGGSRSAPRKTSLSDCCHWGRHLFGLHRDGLVRPAVGQVSPSKLLSVSFEQDWRTDCCTWAWRDVGMDAMKPVSEHFDPGVELIVEFGKRHIPNVSALT